MPLLGSYPWGRVDAPRCPGGSGNSPDCYLYHFQQVLLNEFCSKMDSWACPCRGPTPGAGWTPPRCPIGSGNSPDYYLYHFQQVLLKEFCSKMDSWTSPQQGPTPGAGWTPPRCPGGSGNFLECHLYPVYMIPHWVTVTMWPPMGLWSNHINSYDLNSPAKMSCYYFQTEHNLYRWSFDFSF